MMEHSDEEEEEEIELSPDQMEKLVQLQDLTGIEDLEVCRALLDSKQWDLEAVAMEHLGILGEEARQEEEQNPPPLMNPQPPPPAPATGGGRVWQRPRSWTAWLVYLITLPARVLTGGLGAVWAFVTSLVGLPPRPTSLVRDPLGDVTAFCSEFESRYGAVHPPFFRGSYSQVLEEAKRELKFLLVYLHCEQHQDTNNFCSNVLASREVTEYITQSMIFWGCSVTRPEGMRVSQALRENSYPALVVIVLRQNRMVVVSRREGADLAPSQLVDWLRETVTEYEAFIVAARAERDERNLDREIRNEQETAYAETLRQDQEREQRRREEEEKVRVEEETERKEAEERERIRKEAIDKKDRIQKQKIDLASEIPEEPVVGSEDAVRVLIKLPGGQRLERRFLASHSLKHIFYFVFCHPDSPDEFDIVSNYPKRRLPCQPTPGEPDPPSLAESGFGRSEMLFVNDLDS